MCILTVSLVVIVVIALKIYFEIKCRSFWSSNEIKMTKVKMCSVVKVLCQVKSLADISKEYYDEFKLKKEHVVGINVAGIPIAIVISPEATKLILDDDSDSFRISTNLFMDGKPSRPHLRDRFSRAFNVIDYDKIHDHMTMYAAITLVNHLEMDAQYHRDIEISDVLERYTTFLVGSNLLEIQCRPILNPNTELRKIGKLLNTEKSQYKKLLSYCCPKYFDKFAVSYIDPVAKDYFIRKLSEIWNFRSRFNLGEEFLLEICKPVNNESESIECCSQILEASNTMATTMSYLLFELALNQNIQDELREEISTIYYRDNFTFRYDSINQMSYMDRVISETLRKYPPHSTLHRVALKNTRLPNGSIIPKGVHVIIPTLGFHNDLEYFPNPNKFDPDRFADMHPLPFTYMPFGAGHYKCIGAKFALHQIKIAIAYVIRSYRFDVCDRTESSVPGDSIGMWNVRKTRLWLNISKSR